jgi:hypothetical protein
VSREDQGVIEKKKKMKRKRKRNKSRDENEVVTFDPRRSELQSMAD